MLGDDDIGLVEINLGPPLASMIHRTKGFDYGAVAILESAEYLEGYIKHPAHQEYVNEMAKK